MSKRVGEKPTSRKSISTDHRARSLTALANPKSSVDRKAILQWVERVATFFAERYGLPPITGRILGWLMICDPPEQSAADIAQAIGASRASLTTNMRLLTGGGLVHRLTRSGGRTAYYRVDDDAWEKVIRQRVESMTAFSRIADEGISLVGPASPRATRIRAARTFFQWAAERLAEAPQPLSKPAPSPAAGPRAARASRGRRTASGSP
jgi:predicted transcriptional regulator